MTLTRKWKECLGFLNTESNDACKDETTGEDVGKHDESGNEEAVDKRATPGLQKLHIRHFAHDGFGRTCQNIPSSINVGFIKAETSSHELVPLLMLALSCTGRAHVMKGSKQC